MSPFRRPSSPTRARSSPSNRRGDAVKKFMRYVGTPGAVVFVMSWLPFWKKLTAIAHTLGNDLEIIAPHHQARPLPGDKWARVTVPTLVMDGGKSPAWMRNAMKAWAAVFPNGVLPHLCAGQNAHGEAGRTGTGARPSSSRLRRGRVIGKRIGLSALNGLVMSLITDFRYAFRSLARVKGLAITVIVTLALGIGANAAIFSVVRGVLLRPLVNRDEDRLIYIRQSAKGIGMENANFSVPEIKDLQARVKPFSAFGDFSTSGSR